MASKRVLVTTCDFCETERGVESHELKVDQEEQIIDACKRCWRPHRTALTRLLKVGRPKPRRRVIKA